MIEMMLPIMMPIKTVVGMPSAGITKIKSSNEYIAWASIDEPWNSTSR